MGRRRLRVALTLALLLLAVTPAWAADQAWLLGRWELLRDPNGGAQDWIEFGSDGRVAVAKRNGRRFTGRYQASEAEVRINYKIGSESVITTLTPSSDRQELYARSAVTGKNAVYAKRP